MHIYCVIRINEYMGEREHVAYFRKWDDAVSHRDNLANRCYDANVYYQVDSIYVY